MLVDTWLSQGLFIVVYPHALISELKNVPSKSRLARRIHLDDLEDLIRIIEEDGFLVEPKDIPELSRDPDDDVFLSCARASQADYLVTGDNDLLILKQHGNTKIVNPAEFLKILDTG